MAKPAKPFKENIPVGDNNSVRIQSRDSINNGHLNRIPWWGRGTCIILLMTAINACSLQFEDVNQGDPTSNSYQTELPSEISASKIIIDEVPNDQGESLCDSYQPTLITDFEVRQTIPLEKPPARIEYLDPVFDTCLVRVTDHSEIIDPDEPTQGLKNEYSRVQSFNADGSFILVMSTTGNWYVYDGVTLDLLGQLPISVEPRWDAEDPDLIYFIEETALKSHRLSTGSTEIVHEFRNDFPDNRISAVWTRYEGRPTADTRYWGLMAEDEEWMPVALLIYDLKADQVISMREVDNRKDIDSVTISPLGYYLLAFHDDYCEVGQLGDDVNPCGLMIYDRNLQNGRGLLRIVGHSDLVMDGNGREVLVFQDIDSDYLSMLNLESGEITPLWSIDFSHSAIGFHFSGNAYQQPGWILVSTYNGAQPSATWMDDQVFALELKPGGRVVRFAHSRSLWDENQEHDYWAEPHASVNQDFTRILFTSNWGRSGSEEVDMYLIELPNDWMVNLSHE
jgi:hypothetical protein